MDARACYWPMLLWRRVSGMSVKVGGRSPGRDSKPAEKIGLKYSASFCLILLIMCLCLLIMLLVCWFVDDDVDCWLLLVSSGCWLMLLSCVVCCMAYGGVCAVWVWLRYVCIGVLIPLPNFFP